MSNPETTKDTECSTSGGHRYVDGRCEWCDAERSWLPLKQPFTDNLMDDILRNMTDEELDAVIQRQKERNKP